MDNKPVANGTPGIKSGVPVANGAPGIKSGVPIANASSYSYQKPIRGKIIPRSKYIELSLRFFNQINNFGLDECNARWFISLLEALKYISSLKRDPFLGDRGNQKTARYHPINWDAKNIPIQRSQFTWLNQDYLNNEREFPFYQFTISISKGRIVGFWDECFVFNILLFDPKHNIQPCKIHNYQIRPCNPLENEYEYLKAHLNDLQAANKECQNHNNKCPFHEKLQNGQLKDESNLLVILNESTLKKAIDTVQEMGTDHTFNDLFEYGIIKIEELSSPPVA